MAEYPIKVEVPFEEKASRLEAIIRIFYGIVLVIIFVLWSIPVCLAAGLQWLNILILGKRNQSLYNFMAGFFRFSIRVQGYLLNEFTDVRPPISSK